jgi:hypothetical protein
MKKIRIGNSSGFWGDFPGALKKMSQNGKVDYLTSDYLAEVSMSILRKQQTKNADVGYVADFVNHFLGALPHIVTNGIKIITNAGGNNPKALGIVINEILKKEKLNLKVVAIEGDNILDDLNTYDDNQFQNFDTGEKFNGEFKSANAYIGVAGIIKAIELNADIIIAGRVTDSALAMAPMIHHLNWSLDDYRKLGSGMLAAHCIECGTQITGGNFTDWDKIKDWGTLGFPIIEVYENGDFTVSKHNDSGGLVSVDTVREQLLYEIKDPKLYFSPDVVSDLTNLKIVQLKDDCVQVKGGNGQEPTAYYKVSASYLDGYKATGSLIISGPQAVKKAKLVKQLFWDKTDIKFHRSNTEFVGFNACTPSEKPINESNEVLIRFHAHDYNHAYIKKFCENVASMVLSGPQGISVIGGRPRIQEVYAYWPFLISKENVKIKIIEIDTNKTHDITPKKTHNPSISPSYVLSEKNIKNWPDEGVEVYLSQLCLARSGDKGDNVNIGLAARSEVIYKFLEKHLTPSMLRVWFDKFVNGQITRYQVPGLLSFNFFLEEALDGGGTLSLRIDAQGKTFAAQLLNQKIKVPEDILNSINK